MVPLAQLAFLLVLAATPVLLVTSLLHRARPARARHGGDPVAFPLRRSLG